MLDTEKATGEHYTFETCHQQGYAEKCWKRCTLERKIIENDMQKNFEKKDLEKSSQSKQHLS